MPLIQTNKLPAFERLRKEGQPIINPKRAEHQDIRELHIGVLNMMQDAALEATERQFLRLIGNSAQIAQMHAHFFTLDSIKRNERSSKHIDEYYERFEDIKKQGLDALIVTGANVSEADLTKEVFWSELCEVLDWAVDNVSSTICACLSAHAAMRHFYGVRRTQMPAKLWGLYPHHKADRKHPLMSWVNTQFNVPHSRFNTIERQEFEDVNCQVLVESAEAGVHIALSPDLFRLIFVQGHLEYDTHSLLKEYKREVQAFIDDERDSYPPFPENYFSSQSKAILLEHETEVLQAKTNGVEAPEFPEQLIQERLFNTWRDSAKSFMNNWIGLVYQTTHFDQHKQYMDHIDPEDPLGLK